MAVAQTTSTQAQAQFTASGRTGATFVQSVTTLDGRQQLNTRGFVNYTTGDFITAMTGTRGELGAAGRVGATLAVRGAGGAWHTSDRADERGLLPASVPTSWLGVPTPTDAVPRYPVPHDRALQVQIRPRGWASVFAGASGGPLPSLPVGVALPRMQVSRWWSHDQLTAQEITATVSLAGGGTHTLTLATALSNAQPVSMVDLAGSLGESTFAAAIAGAHGAANASLSRQRPGQRSVTSAAPMVGRNSRAPAETVQVAAGLLPLGFGSVGELVSGALLEPVFTVMIGLVVLLVLAEVAVVAAQNGTGLLSGVGAGLPATVAGEADRLRDRLRGRSGRQPSPAPSIPLAPPPPLPATASPAAPAWPSAPASPQETAVLDNWRTRLPVHGTDFTDPADTSASDSPLVQAVRQCLAQASFQECTTLPVFMPGSDIYQAAAHDYDAIHPQDGSTPQPAVLHAATGAEKKDGSNGITKATRAWYSSTCKTPTPARHCDEYPLFATAEGGPGASVRLIDAKDNRGEGRRYGRFTAVCHLVPARRTFLVVPLVVPGDDEHRPGLPTMARCAPGTQP